METKKKKKFFFFNPVHELGATNCLGYRLCGWVVLHFVEGTDLKMFALLWNFEKSFRKKEIPFSREALRCGWDFPDA